MAGVQMLNQTEFDTMFSSLDLSQDPYELYELYKKVVALNPKNILEIGVGNGGATMFWMDAIADGGLVVGINQPGLVPKHLDQLINRSNKTFKFIYEKSQDLKTVDMVNSYMLRGTVDFLFIDGDHDYAVVKADYENYSPFVRPGGIIGFHDVASGDPQKVYLEIKGQLENTQEWQKTIGTGMGYKK